MAQRVFGPIRGAGVQITELEGQKPIEPGALGWVGYAGLLEKGPVGKLIFLTSKDDAFKKTGSYIDDSLLPDAIEDFFDLAAGAGGVMVVRVTDGNEQAAGGYQLADHVGEAANLFARRDLRTPVGRIKAKNGGRWGGKEKYWTSEVAVTGDIDEITLDTGLSAFTKDEWKGGYLSLAGVPNKRYEIVGNTAAGVITVAADSKMASDLAAGADPTNKRYYLEMENEGKALSFEIRDGEELPDTEFGLFVYVDGVLTNQWPDLSMDPNNKRYWVNIINKDGNNDEIEVEDLFTGTRTADVRPANYYATSSSLTATSLGAKIFDYTVNSPGGGNATVALGTTSDEMLEQVLTLTFTDPTTFNVASDRFGSIATGETLGAAVTSANKYVPPFTATAGASPMAAGDTIVLQYKPLKPNALVDGFLYPDKANEPRLRFRITANDHDTITVAPGSDLTNAGAIAAGAEFMVVAPQELMDGRDGHSEVGDAEYLSQAWDVDNSPFNQTEGKNLGLVKFATPGVTSTAVQKGGVAYASAKNHQYRYEVPSNMVSEAQVDAYVNDTLGRSNYAVVSFPSYGEVPDPQGGGEGKLKEVSLTGMIHGREARIANDYLGYHKAEAGIEATLPAVLDIPTGDRILNEEILNPRGINVIKKARGNFVLWGDRTLWTDPTWKWKHQREQMSYYEHVLQESFDFIIFALHSPATRGIVKSSMLTFFLPEYSKGALDNDFPFTEAAIIKADTENNTPLDKEMGDLNVDVLLKLVGVVERLRIRIGKQGIFEDVA